MAKCLRRFKEHMYKDQGARYTLPEVWNATRCADPRPGHNHYSLAASLLYSPSNVL